MDFFNRNGISFGKDVKGGFYMRIYDSLCWGVEKGVGYGIFRGVGGHVKISKM